MTPNRNPARSRMPGAEGAPPGSLPAAEGRARRRCGQPLHPTATRPRTGRTSPAWMGAGSADARGSHRPSRRWSRRRQGAIAVTPTRIRSGACPPTPHAGSIRWGRGARQRLLGLRSRTAGLRSVDPATEGTTQREHAQRPATARAPTPKPWTSFRSLDMSEHKKDGCAPAGSGRALVRPAAEQSNRRHSLLRVSPSPGACWFPDCFGRLGRGRGLRGSRGSGPAGRVRREPHGRSRRGLDSFYHFGERWRHYGRRRSS